MLWPAAFALLAGCVPSLQDPTARFPTKVLAAPYVLAPGTPVGRDELIERLKRLRYTPSANPAEPGTFRADAASVTVSLRGFVHPLAGAEPTAVVATFEGGRVARLASHSGPAVAEARLEPELLFEFSGPKRVRREPSEFERLPKHLLDAVVAVEDRRFYRHLGIDPRGLLRAARRNVKEGRLAQGGSTITQQLARNLYLSQRRTFGRKLREMFIAVALEMRFSKEELLRMYLDEVYFGQDGPVSVCGIQAASRFFFDKTPDGLTLGEAALLAGLLASPYQFNPFRDPDRALARRRIVLDAMREQGFLTPEEMNRARLEPLKITRAGHRPGRPADFFIATVQEELERRYSGDVLVSEGLTIHTTLDPWLQERAQKAARKATFEAALVALDPLSGAVRALVGGKDFAKSPFNRAVSARRQPGSAFKPFVYGAALRAGAPRWTAASLLPDKAQSYPADGKDWTPRNYDGIYRGTTTLRQAVSLSLNAPTVHLAAGVGPRRIADFARELGIKSELRLDLGLALGDSEVTLLELTAAYAAFANGGLQVEPYAVSAVVSRDGDVLEYRKAQGTAVLSPEEAWLLTDLLRGPVRHGTARGLARWGLDRVAAGKTGTTSDGKDAWFVGYVPGLVAGVWTGQDRPTRSSMTGASHALPIWAEFVSAAAASRQEDPEPWPRPESIVELKVDPETGARARSGCPNRVVEFFLPGTEPADDCPLHSGGVVGWFKRLLR
ncbi:MAG: PBP1A family penicillin-binding protein [Elusimicrobia bacterium]|nr:PBP1A family penicillin-binding protein [Elusimicrobiota bacterium]